MTEQELLLTSVLRCRRVDLYAQPPVLTPEQEQEFARMSERLQKGEPVQYILGECEFMGLNFKVDGRVLVPRPETELLVENVLAAAQQKGAKPIRILDLGTGSGNIAISLAKLLPNSSLVAIDVSTAVLEVAYENALAHDVADRVQFINPDMRDFLVNFTGAFDIIVSNPPYIPTGQLASLPENVKREPVLALDGGSDGLDFYRVIIDQSEKFLRWPGWLFLEIGDGQKPDIEKLFEQKGIFSEINFIKDYSGTDRIVSAQLRSDLHG